MKINSESVRYHRLATEDIVSEFDCGDEDLNDFIRTDASLYNQARLATSYILEDTQSGKIMAYFSLAHDRISLTDFPNNSAYNRFRRQFFARGKMFKSYPALKICRLETATHQLLNYTEHYTNEDYYPENIDYTIRAANY